MPLAATYRCVDMKALARYQIVLLGEQRHIDVNNLPKVVARQCDHKSDTLTTTPPSHLHNIDDNVYIYRYNNMDNITKRSE